MQEPRVIPLPLAQMPESVRTIQADLRVQDLDNTHLWGVMARHPDLALVTHPLGEYLLFSGRLPPRDRELEVLRTAVLTHCDYVWGHHRRIALNAGMTTTEIDRVVAGPEHPDWSPFDAALLQAIDDLHHDSQIRDTTWNTIAAHYDEQQLLELLVLAGHCHTYACIMKGARIPLEPHFEGIPET